jgi:hypothetical protein
MWRKNGQIHFQKWAELGKKWAEPAFVFVLKFTKCGGSVEESVEEKCPFAHFFWAFAHF